ncbi:hypothetical protein [Limnobacter sp.]|uniref:hypothetical protein n=1 Tax=Limnobacter sp. TaxID=2003368 RepID=UPI002FDF31A7
MNAATESLEQLATITSAIGNVQLIRDGFFLPAQTGMILLPGDRIVSGPNAKAVIQFTGVDNALVIENDAAATFNLEVLENDQPPQWIATDMLGEGVYFEDQAAIETTAATEEKSNIFGLFTTSTEGDSTGFPVLESVAFLGATAAIYSDNENNTTTESNTNAAESETPNNPNPQPTPEPEPEPEPDPQPEPEPEPDTFGPIPLGSLPLPEQINDPQQTLLAINLV